MNKFLVIQTAFIGDVILATALVEQIKAQHQNAVIHFLLRKGTENVLENNPNIEKVFIWDKIKNKYVNYVSILKLIRTEKYSHVLNVHRYFSSGFITILSQAKETVGFDKNPLSLFFTKKIKHEFGTNNHPVHEVERNARLIEHIVDNQCVKPKIYPQKKDYLKIQPIGSYITISPNSVWFTKQWPIEKWTDFIDRVGGELSIYLLGGGNDISLCNKIKLSTNHRKVEVVAGKLSLLESAALMAGAKMNFVNDSAPLHLASAINAPVTAIFCSTIPAFGFTPLSDDSVVLESPILLKCRPCSLHGKKACPKQHFKCADIQVERLLERL